MKSFFLSFIVIILFLSTSGKSIAQEAVINQATSSSKPTTISYELAYPGMLPDSPFYKFKILRDKIITFLISDPQKKIDFYLLQADKGLRSASMLVDKGNIALAKETALKAEHNMTLIPDQLGSMQIKPGNEVFERLETASKKHQEILARIIGITDGEDRKVFLQVLDFSKRNLSSIENYQRKSSREREKSK